MKQPATRRGLAIIAMLLMYICGAKADAEEPEKVETLVIHAPAKFVQKRPPAVGKPDDELDTILLIPIDGTNFEVIWDRDIIGKSRKLQPIDLESGREYTFYVKRIFVNSLGIYHILEIKVNGTVIWQLK